jgi:hypothetical protein
MPCEVAALIACGGSPKTSVMLRCSHSFQLMSARGLVGFTNNE